MAHRKPPERSQAGATGKELKKNCISHSKGAGMGEHTAIFGLSKEVLEKNYNKLFFVAFVVLTEVGYLSFLCSCFNYLLKECFVSDKKT